MHYVTDAWIAGFSGAVRNIVFAALEAGLRALRARFQQPGSEDCPACCCHHPLGCLVHRISWLQVVCFRRAMRPSSRAVFEAHLEIAGGGTTHHTRWPLKRPALFLLFYITIIYY